MQSPGPAASCPTIAPSHKSPCVCCSRGSQLLDGVLQRALLVAADGLRHLLALDKELEGGQDLDAVLLEQGLNGLRRRVSLCKGDIGVLLLQQLRCKLLCELSCMCHYVQCHHRWDCRCGALELSKACWCLNQQQ